MSGRDGGRCRAGEKMIVNLYCGYAVNRQRREEDAPFSFTICGEEK